MSDTRLLDEVRDAVLGPCGVRRGDRVLLACSGGRDSTAMADILAGLRDDLALQLDAATVDHQWREESHGEVQAAREVCAQLEISWRCLPAPVDDRALRQRGSEAAAREARRGALAAEADRIGAAAIALAHHRDDQAETVLMRAVVGAGNRGLAAMRPRAGRWVRPLLGVARVRLEAHVALRRLGWRDDPTNDDPRFLRNRLRHDVMPALERCLGPSASVQLARLADRSAVDEDLLSTLAESAVGNADPAAGVPVTSLESLHPAIRVRALRDLAMTAGARPGAAHLDAALRLLEGRDRTAGVDLPGSARLERRGGRLFACTVQPSPGGDDSPRPLRLDGETAWPAAGLRIQARVRASAGELRRTPGAGAYCAWFDLDRLTIPPLMHKFAPGTRMRPFGASGTRKVSDVLSEAGIPRESRRVWPVVTVDSEVIWVPGARAAEYARVGDGTARILELALGESP